MAGELNGKHVAILAADGVERVELKQSRQALNRAEALTELLSRHDGNIQARNNDLEHAGTFDVDALVRSASVEDHDGLLLPGGTVNPDKLRVDEVLPGLKVCTVTVTDAETGWLGAPE